MAPTKMGQLKKQKDRSFGGGGAAWDTLKKGF